MSQITTESTFFNPRPAGVFGRTRLPGGGGESVTQERMTVARRAGLQTKALDKYLLSKFLKKILKGHMSGQGQVKDQNRHFSPYRLLWRD